MEETMENNNDNHNNYPSWLNQPAQNNEPPQHPSYDHTPKRRKAPFVIAGIVLILVLASAVQFVASRIVNHAISSPQGASIPAEGISFDQAGVHLNISLTSSRLVLQTHNSPNFLVTYTGQSRGRCVCPDFEFSQNGMRLDITQQPNVNFGLFGTNSSSRGILTVYIPRHLEDPFSTANISTSSGNIEIRGNNGNRLAADTNIRASSGRIQAENFTADTIDVRSSSGNISLDRLTAQSGDITARASSGRLDASHIAARNIDLNTSSGNITANNLTAESALTASASSGRITLTDTTAATTRITASSGNVTATNTQTTSGDFTARTSSGRINLTNPTINGNLSAESTSGNITIQDPTATQISGRATSGNITITGPIEENQLSVRTTSGNIRVNGQRW